MDEQADRRSMLNRRLLALGGLLFAGALLVAAWPRMQASLHYLPVDTAIKRYFASNEIPTAQLPALRGRARESIALYDHYRYHDGLSLLNYLEAIDPATAPWRRRPALVRSERAGVDALRQAPAKPRTWLRVARARAAIGRSEAQVVAPLRMSIFTGRVEPTLLVPRLELGYAYLPGLDEETVALLRDQTLLAWRVRERDFRRAVSSGRLDLSRVESVLGIQGKDILDAMGGER